MYRFAFPRLLPVLTDLRPVLTGLRPVLTGLRPVLTGLRPVLTGLLPVLTAGLVGCAGSPQDSGTAPIVYDPHPPDVLGGDRPAEVVLPTDYAVDTSWPLVIMLHGYGATSDLQNVVFGLEERVDPLAFILVKPEGTVDSTGAQFWNATPECCDFGNTGVDDVAYLTGLIDEARTLYPLSRVAIVGHSNGGFMAYRMACDAPDRLDHIAVLAGATYKDEDDCTGDVPVSVLHIHGTDDETIAYASDPTHAGAEESIGRWASKAGCDEPPADAGTRDYLRDTEGAETTVSEWSGCAPDIDVALWSVAGGDHVMLDNTTAFKDDLAAFATGNSAATTDR